MEAAMGITIKDIAKAAGVSHTTVSRALRDHPALSTRTIEKIKDLAAQMGYVPSATARGLKTRRSCALGAIVSYIEDPFWSEVLHGIDDILHPAGYSLFVAATHREKQREKEVVQAMVQRGVDGVIVCAPQFSPEQSRLLQAYGLPMAIVNNEGAGEYQYLLYNDDIYGIRLVTRHLIDLGHRRIVYLGNARGGTTTENRERGFREEMSAAGFDVRESDVIMAPESTPLGGYEGAQVLLALPETPTAVICYNDYLAVGVYRAFIQAGFCIPQDISVTGFDDINVAAYLNPPLTTLRQFKYDMGVGAARMMLEILEQKRDHSENLPAHQKVRIKGELCIRSSTAPPSRP
jgi:DNA-binding LacI/PurR family transcriptional regulator